MKNWTQKRTHFLYGALTVIIPMIIIGSATYIFINAPQFAKNRNADEGRRNIKGISIQQASDNVTISKVVDKLDVQRDDPASGAQDVNYTITVTTGSCDPVPLDIGIVFDRSGSMGDPYDPNLPENPANSKMTLAKEATINFIGEMDASKDRIGLASYSDTGRLDQPLTSNFTDVSNGINALQPENYTNVAGGLNVMTNHMVSNVRQEATPVIILFTDGIANLPVDIPTGQQAARDEAIQTKNANIRLITVSFGLDGDDVLLQDMADGQLGTNFYDVNQPLDLEQVFVDIAADLNTTYANLVVNDDITQLLQYADLTSIPSNATFANGTLTWDLGPVPCEQVIELPFPTTVQASAPDLSQMFNQATVTVDNTTNLDSQQVITTIHAPILNVLKTDNQTVVQPGALLTYNVSVSNTGTGNAYGVTITDDVPTEVTVDPSTISHNGTLTSSTITWDNDGPGYIFDGSFGPTGSNVGPDEVYSFSGTVDPNAQNGDSIENTTVVADSQTSTSAEDDTDVEVQQSSSSSSSSTSSNSSSSSSSNSTSSSSSNSSNSTNTSSNSTSSNSNTFTNTGTFTATIGTFSSLPETGELPDTGIFEDITRNIWIKGAILLFIGWVLLRLLGKLEFTVAYDEGNRNAEFEKRVERRKK